MDFEFYGDEKVTPQTFPAAKPIEEEKKVFIHSPSSLEDARRKYIKDTVDLLLNELCRIMVTKTTQSAKMVAKISLRGDYEQLMKQLITDAFELSGWQVEVLLKYEEDNCTVTLDWREKC